MVEGQGETVPVTRETVVDIGADDASRSGAIFSVQRASIPRVPFRDGDSSRERGVCDPFFQPEIFSKPRGGFIRALSGWKRHAGE